MIEDLHSEMFQTSTKLSSQIAPEPKLNLKSESTINARISYGPGPTLMAQNLQDFLNSNILLSKLGSLDAKTRGFTKIK